MCAYIHKADRRAGKRYKKINSKSFMFFYGDIFGASAKFNRRKRSGSFR